MRTMTSVEAKNRFGAFLDTMQREPVVVTKNNRPVGIMISMEDAGNTLIDEIYMQQEEGYDGWFREKVEKSLKELKNGTLSVSDHEDVMARVRSLLK